MLRRLLGITIVLAIVAQAHAQTQNAAPTVNIVTPAVNAVYTAPASISVTADAADSDGSIAKVEFHNGSNLIGTATEPLYTANWTNVAAGSYSITATATDNVGAVSVSPPVNITVNPKPAITLTSPAGNATYLEPAKIVLVADVSASASRVVRVDFFNGTRLITRDTAAPFQYVWQNVPSGTYTIIAKSTDSSGNVKTSEPVTITVKKMTGIYFIHADHLNTPRMLTDQVNKPVWRWDGEAFGTSPPDESPSGGNSFTFNLRFPGQYYDRETNLHYNYFRDYDPATGRYVQSDPIGLEGGLNTYTYVEGDPLYWADPLGLYKCVGSAVCDFTPRMDEALKCFDKCTKRETKITCGQDSHKPTDPHMKGDGADIGGNTNPDLSRESAESCFFKCFPSGKGGSYGQQEYNGKDPSKGYHYHFQYTPGRGGATGFPPGIRSHGR